MVDVFISYVRHDKERVAPLVEVLRGDGFDVWWDDDLLPDVPWEATIEQALYAATVVIVCWSAGAVASDNVRSEARWARTNERLLQLFLDKCDPPLFFGERQGIDISRWNGSREAVELARLSQKLRELLSIEARPRTASGPIAPATGREKPANAGAPDAVATMGMVPPATPPASPVSPRVVDRRRMIGGSVAFVAAAAGVGAWRLTRGGSAAGDSVAVLPFANLSGDPAQAYFSDGIAEELRGALARIVRLKVAARASSELMRAADIPTAAQKLGVANIVTGSVRRSGGTIRIGAQLVDGSSGLVRWSDTYDRAVGDVLTIETGIAEKVANALNIVLGRAEKLLLSAGGTTNPAAHDAYLRGAAFEAAQKPYAALPEYAVAVAADPNFALALAGHASISCWLAVEFATRPGPTLALAAAEARRAVALAPGLGAPHAILGFILYQQFDFRGADTAFATAVRLAPNDAFLLGRYSIYLGGIGRGDEAVRLMERAQQLDPLRPNGPLLLGWALYSAARFAAAVAPLRQAVTRLPDDIEAKLTLSQTLILLKQPAEGLTIALTIPPGNGFREGCEALARTKLGDRAAADAALDRLRAMDAMRYTIAEVHAQRGEIDAAFAALDGAVADREQNLVMLKGDPLMRPLHGDPRYAALLRRIGYP